MKLTDIRMGTLAALVLLASGGAFGAGPVTLAPIQTVPHELDVLLKAGHVQGATCSEEGIYLSHQFGIEMIGWDGRLIRRLDVPYSHLGDIAYADGKVYGVFGLHAPGRKKYGAKGLVKVWDAKLNPIREKAIDAQLDGAVVFGDTLYAGVDKWGKGLHDGCCVRLFDLDLNEKGEKTIDLGYKIAYGVQTMATDGKDLFFGNYGGTSRVSADLKDTNRLVLHCAEGFGLVPKSVTKRETPVFFTVNALGGNMQGWRKDPTNNPPRIEIRFYDYKDGKFSVIGQPSGSK